MIDIEKLNLRLRSSGKSGLFHDSRADSRMLINVCNELVDKINELVEEVNSLMKKQSIDADNDRCVNYDDAEPIKYKCAPCKDELCNGSLIYDGRKCDGIPF